MPQRRIREKKEVICIWLSLEAMYSVPVVPIELGNKTNVVNTEYRYVPLSVCSNKPC